MIMIGLVVRNQKFPSSLVKTSARRRSSSVCSRSRSSSLLVSSTIKATTRSKWRSSILNNNHTLSSSSFLPRSNIRTLWSTAAIPPDSNSVTDDVDRHSTENQDLTKLSLEKEYDVITDVEAHQDPLDLYNSKQFFSSTTDSDHLHHIHTEEELMEIVMEYARIPQTAASLQMLLRTGRGEMLGKSYKSELLAGGGDGIDSNNPHVATQRILIHMAQLLRREIPIRLAHRIRDLLRVPVLRDMPSVRLVQKVYLESFRRLIEFPPIYTAGDEHYFAHMLEELYNKHANVLVLMARGAYELREQQISQKRRRRSKTQNNLILRGSNRNFNHIIHNHHPFHDVQQQQNHSENDKVNSKKDDDEDDWEFARMHECHAFLDRFYMSRIGIRVLVGQYLALRAPPPSNNNRIMNDDDTIGMICLKTSPRDLVRRAADDARKMCRSRYGRAPLVELSGNLDLTFAYIPTYLHYMLLELLKNALRATCEHHGDGPLPKVEVIIADGMELEDVAIKIADEGGGIKRSKMNKIWSYLYTTADPSIQQAFLRKKSDHDNSSQSPIAGLGYGLPISRAYCRYFGGAMDLVSMEGFGTDAFLHLKRLGDANEPLPV